MRRQYLLNTLYIRTLVNSGEALRALDGLDELLLELGQVLVRGQVYSVKARVGSRIVVLGAPPLYREQLGPIATVQLFESVHWNA